MKEIDRIEFESIEGMGMWQEWRIDKTIVTRVPGGFVIARVDMGTDVSSGAVYVQFPTMAEVRGKECICVNEATCFALSQYCPVHGMKEKP